MKTTSFFATPDEISDWIQDWRIKFGLDLGAVLYQPLFQLFQIHLEDRFDKFWEPLRAEGAIREAWLTLDPLKVVGEGEIALRMNNPDRLEIHLPKVSESSYTQCDLGSVSKKSRNLGVWRKIVADLKRKTEAGMWVMNRESRTKTFYKDKLFSQGIKEKVNRGFRLLNLTGLEVSILEPGVR